MLKLKFLLPLIAFAVLVALLFAGLSNDPRKVPSPLVNKATPDFELPRLSEPGVMFSPKMLLGKVWALNIWASWCNGCRVEHPVLNELARQDLISIVGFDYKDTNDQAKAWLDRLGNPYRLVVTDQKGSVGFDYGVYGVPETFFIDKKGIIRYKHIGPISYKDLTEIIIPLIKELKAEK